MNAIYTAGYAGWTAPALKAKVEELGAALVDIRYRPTSRRPEFTREALAALFGRAYHHVPALGNVNYQGGPVKLADPAAAVLTMGALLQHVPIVLLCACKEPAFCHRSDAAAYLAARLSTPVIHLLPMEQRGQLGEGQIYALTLTQPWASLVALGAKRIETRSWPTAHRGALAIHSAKGLADLGGERGLAAFCAREPFRTALVAGGITSTRQLPRGAVVALAELVNVEQIDRFNIPDEPERSFGNYEPGRYAWRLDQVRALPAALPARGALGLWPWTLPAALAAKVAE